MLPDSRFQCAIINYILRRYSKLWVFFAVITYSACNVGWINGLQEIARYARIGGFSGLIDDIFVHL